MPTLLGTPKIIRTSKKRENQIHNTAFHEECAHRMYYNTNVVLMNDGSISKSLLLKCIVDLGQPG